jgi:tetratricopeptide (TPR) repeat protein
MALGKAEGEKGADPRGTYRKAIDDFSKALAKEPGIVRAQINRGNAFRILGEAEGARGGDPRGSHRRAIEDLTRVLASLPGDPFVAGSRGRAHLKLGRAEAAHGDDPRASYRKSVEDFDKAVAGNSEDPTFFLDRGTAHWSLGKAEAARGRDPGRIFENAIDAFTEALEKNPRSWRAHANRAILLEYQGKYGEAVAAYEKALAGAREKSPRLEAMLRQARVLLSATPDKRRLSRGHMAMDWGAYGTARELYEKALAGGEEPARPDPFRAGAHYNLACVYSLLSAGRSAPKAEPRSLPHAEVAALREKAVTALRKAFHLGFSNLAGLREDSDLNPVRSHSGFKQLVKDWEEKLDGKGK